MIHKDDDLPQHEDRYGDRAEDEDDDDEEDADFEGEEEGDDEEAGGGDVSCCLCGQCMLPWSAAHWPGRG